MRNLAQIYDGFNFVGLCEPSDLSYEKPNFIVTLYKECNKIIVPPNHKLVIVELFSSYNKSYDLNREIQVGENSNLEYLRISTIHEGLELNIDYDIVLKQDSSIDFHIFDFGEGMAKNTIHSNLDEDNIDLKINSLVKLKANAQVSNNIQINHNHPNTRSDLKIRHLLDENSKATFEALSVVNENAKNSKAFQDSKTILLSDDAIIKSNPHLEILIDELEASHGSTTGGLNKEEMYYLQSRGLDKQSAKSILIEGFSNIAIDNIKDEYVKEWFMELVRG
jgi:Fe-S cluster assembly protein SufD